MLFVPARAVIRLRAVVAVTSSGALPCVAAVVLALVPARAQTNCFSTHTDELFPQNGTAGDGAGISLAMSAAGDRIVIGSSGHDHAASNDGSVYVLSDLGTPSQSEVEVRPSLSGEESVFGAAVAISAAGDVLVVGAPGFMGTSPGFMGVFVFRFDGTNWNEEWHAAGGYDNFGAQVAMNAAGDVIAVGADVRRDFIGDFVGGVDVFRHRGGTWVYEPVPLPADVQPFDRFGGAIALSASGQLLAVRSNSHSPVVNGAVYLYERIAGVWTQVTKIQETVAHSNWNFGVSLALDASETEIAIGSPFYWRPGYSMGAVLLYRKSGSSWVLDHELFGLQEGSDDNFGCSVAMTAAGDRVWVGASGERYPSEMYPNLTTGAVYEFNRDNGTWPLQERRFQPNPTHGAGFGRALCVDAAGDRWAASEPTTSLYGPIAGLVHLYDSSCSAAAVYCTAKANSLGCVPQIAVLGRPSVSSTSGFTVSVSNTRNQREGLLVYSTSGR
ncbi:MAG: FG-GAP repeat protein, partial [Acidimicrobiales bacterium]|nr:FG-GAP repeat protein [Acidimicrobiales bacterium]